MPNIRWQDTIWNQFAAAIDTLENAISNCPDALWSQPGDGPQFWRAAFHTLFFLDLYCAESMEAHTPPQPFTSSELEDGGTPPRMFTKQELQDYLEYGRSRCQEVVRNLTDADLERRSGFSWLEMSVVESTLYNLRHVQHHAAQLNQQLRQAEDIASPWVFRGADSTKSSS
ncbi:MAG: DinB family protein [Planctomycetota bacterium]